MTCPSRVALHDMAHSFIKLWKPLCHVKAVICEWTEVLKRINLDICKISQILSKVTKKVC